MYKIKLTARARGELKNISKHHIPALFEIFEDLKEDPMLGKPLTKELAKRFSYRVGIYRLIYVVNKQDQTILILTAGHRSNIYD